MHGAYPNDSSRGALTHALDVQQSAQDVYSAVFNGTGTPYSPYPLLGTLEQRRDYIVQYYSAYIANASIGFADLWSDPSSQTPMVSYARVAMDSLNLACSRTHCLNVAAVIGATLGFTCAHGPKVRGLCQCVRIVPAHNTQ
jgi:hypothetical protein